MVGESLMVGTPVISTECAGITEWLQANRYGIMVENSTDGITSGMRQVLHNPNLLHQFHSVIHEISQLRDFDRLLSSFEKIL